MIDFSMDQIVEAIAAALLLAHAAALVWSGWLRKGIAAVLALNLLVSGTTVIYWGLHIADLAGSIEMLWAFVGFEFVVLVTSLLALFRVRVPPAAIWIEFAAHALITGAALLFMLTFHLTRLIRCAAPNPRQIPVKSSSTRLAMRATSRHVRAREKAWGIQCL